MHAHDQHKVDDQAHDVNPTATATDGHAQDTTQFSSQGPLPDVVAHTAATRHHRTPSDLAFGHVPGGDRNVDMGAINTDHKAHTVPYPTQPIQSSRVSLDKDHAPTKLLPGSHPVYDAAGTQIGHADGGPIDTNAGTFCHLPIKNADGTTTNQPCVLTHGTVPGWIPTSAFVHGDKLGAVQHHMSNEIDRKRHAAHDEADTGAAKFTIVHKESHANLFTKPNEKATYSNEKSHYYGRPNGTQSLFVNVPTWNHDGSEEGERFGVANDTIMAAKDAASGTDQNTFHFTGETAKSPLYHLGQSHAVDEIQFSYGYVINAAGEKRLGWLPHDVLVAKT